MRTRRPPVARLVLPSSPPDDSLNRRSTQSIPGTTLSPLAMGGASARPAGGSYGRGTRCDSSVLEDAARERTPSQAGCRRHAGPPRADRELCVAPPTTALTAPAPRHPRPPPPALTRPHRSLQLDALRRQQQPHRASQLADRLRAGGRETGRRTVDGRCAGRVARRHHREGSEHDRDPPADHDRATLTRRTVVTCGPTTKRTSVSIKP